MALSPFTLPLSSDLSLFLFSFCILSVSQTVKLPDLKNKALSNSVNLLLNLFDYFSNLITTKHVIWKQSHIIKSHETSGLESV